ncbi:hypothetical protein PIB30_060539 [Stylosanthes scabra]|uniref:Uncharacterized protein n=1 Tax=Stylosanthes scabra TaxID=79078 RepID=A0ABU6YJG4_9FABA|nr:hypothetical protein [Stylosanthes scabra]
MENVPETKKQKKGKAWIFDAASASDKALSSHFSEPATTPMVGSASTCYSDLVATTLMKQNCWCRSLVRETAALSTLQLSLVCEPVASLPLRSSCIRACRAHNN